LEKNVEDDDDAYKMIEEVANEDGRC